MIRIRNLHYSFPKATAPTLNGISTEIHPGERVAIIGPNASGKTTLGRCLNGLLYPTAGSVIVDDLDTAETGVVPAIRRRVAMVFQNPDDQLVTTSVESEIAFGLENLGVPLGTMRERVNDVLQRFGLEAHRTRPPHLLSGGEKQRLAIASSFALHPRYFVLDEPTSMLDTSARLKLLEVIDEMSTHEKIATIHITQFVEEAARADRVIAMDQGRIILDGSPASVFADADRLQSVGLELPFLFALATRVGPTSPHTPTLGGLVRKIASSAHGQPLTSQIPDDKQSLKAKRANVRVEDVYFSYDIGSTRVPALCGVSADLSTGGSVGVIGNSGSGKSTLAQHLNGLLKPRSGRVLLNDLNIHLQPQAAIRRRVGLVFQYPEIQLFDETVAADVAFGPRNAGCDDAETQRRVKAALEAVALPLAKYGQRTPTALSGGERRLAAIAGVLAMDPDVFVLDEPTAGLDPLGFALLVDLLSKLRERGVTLVLITHDVRLVAAATSRVLALSSGRVSMEGHTDEVLASPDFDSQTGLHSPPASQFVQQLRAAGVPVPPGITSQQQVLDFATQITEQTHNG